MDQNQDKKKAIKKKAESSRMRHLIFSEKKKLIKNLDVKIEKKKV